jgi:hypothetical protein
MRIPKHYGQSREDNCFFCGGRALAENENGLPTCIKHKNEKTPDLKCLCGEYLDAKKGKYGTFFLCMKCGPVSLRKINDAGMVPKDTTEQRIEKTNQRKETTNDQGKKEITIRSDDPDYF